MESMKIFRPVRTGCPNSCNHVSRRNLNSHGCSTHRQPLLCALISAFRPRLTCNTGTLTLAPQPMSIFPYGTLSEITQNIRSKKISPVELVDLHLKRVQTFQSKLSAFVHLDAEAARSQARAAERQVMSGALLGPLHGLPLSVKSCIDVAGWLCPAG